jgi:hypothetical protein
MKKRTEDTGTNNDDWSTPKIIYDWISNQFGRWNFYDPCPLGGKEKGFDGLDSEWTDFNFINPPYSRGSDKNKFIERCVVEGDKGNICILLIPASTDLKIFHDVIVPNAKVYLIKGRVPFAGFTTKGEYVTNKCGQSGSMLCVFGVKYNKGKIFTLDLKEST